MENEYNKNLSKKETTFNEFLQIMWSTPSKHEPIKPEVANDITVTRCRDCPFLEEIQNSWTHSCRLISYSCILNDTKILENCPLRVKSINVSIDWSKTNGK